MKPMKKILTACSLMMYARHQDIIHSRLGLRWSMRDNLRIHIWDRLNASWTGPS